MAPTQMVQDGDSYRGFVSAISEKPEAFLHPTDALYAASLVVSKRLIDPLAATNSVFDQLHTDDMHLDQIWEQIKTITESVVDDILAMELPSKDSQALVETGNGDEAPVDSDEDSPGSLDELDAVRDDDDGQYEDEERDEDVVQEAHSQEDEEMLNDDESDSIAPSDAEYKVEGVDVVPHDGNANANPQDDQFFDADEFAKQLDAMDANYEQEQSADDIDYNADPDEASDEDDDGHERDSGMMEDVENANNIRYEDFFAAPRQQRGRQGTKVKRKHAHFEDENDNDEEDADEEDMTSVDGNEDRTMARMQKDLFADDEINDSASDGPKLSAHAQRQQRLAKEILQLEHDNVVKKDWTLMGEASARARPKDSLLEEGFDFERTSKPVPIVTEEITRTLEDMIKARIIEGRYDTVLRKIPETAHKFSKHSFELDENKPTQSLAEVYETEFQKKQNPGEYKSAADKKLEAEHKEIEALYRDLCYNLDSLSSWHYTPKPVTESLNIVTNAPAIAMEDAQPLTMSSASRLAPQEQYTTSAEKGEVAGKSGLPVSKAEMTSEERQRYRRKQRAVAKKSGLQKKVLATQMSKSKQEQAGVMDTLKRANVKVIRGGKTRDLKSGKEYNTTSTAQKPSNLKL